MKFQFLNENQIYRLKNMLLTEASAISLHQQYDKVFGSNLIDMILAIDTSNKKKFAEWVLRSSVIHRIDGDEIKDDYIDDGTLKKMYDLTAIGKYQAMSYKYLKDAYDAMVEYEEANMNMSPAYEDEKIVIHVPTSYRHLQALLNKVYGKTRDAFHWCVAGSEANHYWSSYNNNDEYHYYLIYNKEKNELFLWNDNPTYAYKMFNDWNDKPVHPFSDGGLTRKAAYWIENQSGDASLYDVVPGEIRGYVFDWEEPCALIDRDENNVYIGDLDLFHSDDGIIEEKWCFGNFDVEINESNLVIVCNGDRDDYSIAYCTDDNKIVGISDRASSYSIVGDYCFLDFDDTYIQILLPTKGVLAKIYRYANESFDGDNIYTFELLDNNWQNALINDCIYSFANEYAELDHVEKIENIDRSQSTVTCCMDEYFELEDIDVDEENIQFDDSLNEWHVTINLETYDIISCIGPES